MSTTFFEIFRIPQRRVHAAVAFAACRRGAAAVEFALVGLAFVAFLLAILNLGLFGFTLSALQKATEQTARRAAVQAAASGAGACPSLSTIQGYFDGYAAPIIPAKAAKLTYGSYSGATGVSTITGPFVDNASTSTPPGTYIALTAAYKWRPVGFAKFSGFTMRVSAVAFAMGSPSC